MALKSKFFEVEIPLTNSKTELLSDSIEHLKNKTIKLDLTRMLRGKNIEAVLKISVENGKAIANVQKLEVMGFFIRRMIRTSISYVEDSFFAECKNALVRVKPFLITRKKVSRAVRKALRNFTNSYLMEYLKNKSFSEVCREIVENKLQKSLSLKLKKIYPLSLCEIRVFKLEKLKQPEEKPEVKIEKIGKVEKENKTEEKIKKTIE